jgi:hypothetical protein
MQGSERRAWYRRHSPAHLRAVVALVEDALAARLAGGPCRSELARPRSRQRKPTMNARHPTAVGTNVFAIYHIPLMVQRTTRCQFR